MHRQMGLGKIAIVGSGAVGSYYGARLAQSGYDVTFLLRSDYEVVNQRGLQVKSVHGDFHLPRVQCVQNSEDIGEVDLVIVAWKATANGAAESVIRPLLGQETAILTLQNGLGNAEYLGQLFGAKRVMAGLCFVCINRLKAGVIAHSASGLIRIGELVGGKSARLVQIAEAFEGSGFPCQAVDSLEKAQWMKLVWNFPFNGLAIAEGGVDTEELLQQRCLEPKVRKIMAEVVAVAAALGHDIPESFIELQIEITLPMGPYRPSSMIDFVDGREVEFDAIWGQPLAVAKRLGVPVPEMQDLVLRIQRKLGLS
ncbi:2-dehydropantoate 2-reductase [Rubritalea marina]|uniref:2-dehydropantoate 2-reductase n=1 Tax=Rubritalea marina TaxID=361055 RepID=UPI00047709F1|nr:2-dehydropantoate 2-reductase [Rubritalea marina]